MRRYSSYLLVILTSFCQVSFGQEKEYIIPFQLTAYNNLSVRAILNGQDTVNLMFHTASSSIDLTEETTRKIRSLKFERTDSVNSWGGAGNSSRFSKGNTLQIGEMTWSDKPVWEDKYSGPDTDGKFGPNLFAEKVIEIDFDKKVMVIRTSLPAKIVDYQKLKLIFEKDALFLEATCEIDGTSFKNRFLIHSGYAGAMLFDDKFVADNKIDEKLKTVDEKELKDSFGNVLKTKKAILPRLMIGTEILSDVPVGFFKGAIGRQKMSIIGGDLLKRFNLIIDAQRAYIYLRPNDLKNTSYTNI
jgi:hypothetical protein